MIRYILERHRVSLNDNLCPIMIPVHPDGSIVSGYLRLMIVG
jgi:hypothetical protein